MGAPLVVLDAYNSAVSAGKIKKKTGRRIKMLQDSQPGTGFMELRNANERLVGNYSRRRRL